jgi:anion-transporting  ArsA/GET3 family ATPase
MTALSALVRHKRLIVCVGAGGVGKTTTAAAVALRAALEGRRALVLTIDPARRLANALGLQEIGNRATRVDLQGREAPGGELHAMMLDPRATLDDVVRRVAPTPELREALYANRIYRHIAGSFSGSQEYMATEQLYDVAFTGRYDIVVLDTPPVKNALDFLDSPGRLTRFLDKQIMKWFLAQEDPGVGRRLLAGTSTVIYGLLGHVFGRDFLDELSTFFKLFGEIYEGFHARHEAVARLFEAADTAFVVVSAPTDSATDVAGFFVDELRSRGMAAQAIVVNQVHRAEATTPDPSNALGPALDAALPDPVARAAFVARLVAAHGRLREVVRSESARVASLSARARGTPLVAVPRQRAEVHDLAGLLTLHRALFDAAAA